jgi:signal transduction histidine kinase
VHEPGAGQATLSSVIWNDMAGLGVGWMLQLVPFHRSASASEFEPPTAAQADLHDGAQQRLLALSYDIRLARAAAQADGDTPAEMALAKAAGDTQGVLEELRELAHGIYPAVLAEAGIAPALATLGDAARRGADHAAVSVAHQDGRVVVTVEDNGTGDASPMMAAADRIGALGGSLTTGPAVCRAEIPCASS